MNVKPTSTINRGTPLQSAYVDVCWRMLTYAEDRENQLQPLIKINETNNAGARHRRGTPLQSAYVDVCWRMLTYAGVCWRMLTYADVCSHHRGTPLQSAYVDVCWRMLTYAGVCWRMLTHADACWRAGHGGGTSLESAACRAPASRPPATATASRPAASACSYKQPRPKWRNGGQRQFWREKPHSRRDAHR
jgi:hypothetical protein